jgi:hypothetical protein
MNFTKSTIREMVRRFGDIVREANDLKVRYAELEHQAAAIRALVPNEVLEAELKEMVVEGLWDDGLAQQSIPLSARIIASLEKLGKPASPTEIAAELADLFENQKALYAKVNAELRRMLRRKDAVIVKVERGMYALGESAPEGGAD